MQVETMACHRLSSGASVGCEWDWVCWGWGWVALYAWGWGWGWGGWLSGGCWESRRWAEAAIAATKASNCEGSASEPPPGVQVMESASCSSFVAVVEA